MVPQYGTSQMFNPSLEREADIGAWQIISGHRAHVSHVGGAGHIQLRERKEERTQPEEEQSQTQPQLRAPTPTTTQTTPTTPTPQTQP